MVRKASQFSCRKRVFSSYGYGEEPENMNFKGSKPRRHLGVIYVCDSCFMGFQCWGLATQPALFCEVKRSWNTSDNGKSLVTPIQLVPALLPAAPVCRAALISGAGPHGCPSPAWRWGCRVCGQRGGCAHKPLANRGRDPQELRCKRGAGRGECGPWAAHWLCAGPRGCFSHRQLGVPVLVLAYVRKPDRLPPDNMLITRWWLYGGKKKKNTLFL